MSPVETFAGKVQAGQGGQLAGKKLPLGVWALAQEGKDDAYMFFGAIYNNQISVILLAATERSIGQ
jgi:hypothetical protein